MPAMCSRSRVPCVCMPPSGKLFVLARAIVCTGRRGTGGNPKACENVEGSCGCLLIVEVAWYRPKMHSGTVWCACTTCAALTLQTASEHQCTRLLSQTARGMLLAAVMAEIASSCEACAYSVSGKRQWLVFGVAFWPLW